MAGVVHREQLAPAAQHGPDAGGETACLAAFHAMDFVADLQVVHPASGGLVAAAVLRRKAPPCGVRLEDRPGVVNDGDVRRDRLHRLAPQDEVVAKRLHRKYADPFLLRDGQYLLLKRPEVRIHHVNRHLRRVEAKPPLFRHLQHP